MLSKKMYTQEYMEDLRKRTGADPTLLEKVVYAFGLLEALKKVGLPFCFKGGTALMLLMDGPKRLSTDIDIIVEPDIDIDGYIVGAGKIFPFIDVKEDLRKTAKNIEKRHFVFRYHSPQMDRDIQILLDVLFEENLYGSTVTKAIKNKFLLTEGEDIFVDIPNVNSILGDKLTAFAPHTTGIHFGEGKELEIIKQLFDCGTLFDMMTDYREVRKTYDRVVRSELRYRGLACSPQDVLRDTVDACLCIAARGQAAGTDYVWFKDGISRIRNHIIGEKFSGEIAGACAARVLYLAAALLTDRETLRIIGDPSAYGFEKPPVIKPKRFSYLRIVDPLSYAYFIEAVKLLEDIQ